VSERFQKVDGETVSKNREEKITTRSSLSRDAVESEKKNTTKASPSQVKTNLKKVKGRKRINGGGKPGRAETGP